MKYALFLQTSQDTWPEKAKQSDLIPDHVFNFYLIVIRPHVLLYFLLWQAESRLICGPTYARLAETLPPTPFSAIATMAAVSSSPITQVSQSIPPQPNLQPQLLTRLQLDLRGTRFLVDRETIMNLPESVLLCLFPNGLVLSRQSVALSDGGDDEEDEVYAVDVREWFIGH